MTQTEQLAQLAIQKRGYCVMGTNGYFTAGDRIDPLWIDAPPPYEPVEHPFVILEETTREDFLEQRKLFGLPLVVPEASPRFYRCVTD